MDIYGNILFSFLNSVENIENRRELYEKLGADISSIYIYYIVPYQNLFSIVCDEGIKCRNSIDTSITDLSGQSVQSKRDSSSQGDRKLTLARKDDAHVSIEIDLHDCINAFWNPLNNTFLAFQKIMLTNAALANGSPSNFLCVLEISLEKVLNDQNIYWGVSRGNLASYYSTVFSKKIFSQFNWKDTFSVTSDKKSNNSRSAEFIAYRKPAIRNDSKSDTLPFSYINRIIVKSSDKPFICSRLPTLSNIIHVNNAVFANVFSLLYSDRKFIEHVVDSDKLLTIKDFIEYLRLFVEMCSINRYIPNELKFKNSYMAFSFHGIGHTVRVLLWSFIISRLNKLPTDIEQALLVSALYHDYQRERNDEDDLHGQRSADKYNLEIRALIKSISLQESCLNAIKYHCVTDQKCPPKKQDIIWEILKDADALDRGRFAAPNMVRGCDISQLRNGILKRSYNYFPDMAYEIATLTKFTKWNHNPLEDLKLHITSCFETALFHGILQENYASVATRFINDKSKNF